jgi:hypothetical protein
VKRNFIVCVALSMVALVGCTKSLPASKTKAATLVLHNIAVLNQNLLTVNEYDIEKTVSELTIVDGKVIYESR